ncbi:MAG TPA: zinc ribbon domain-containing protein [Candidatus Acidoferrales bacterium]|nr:zinc ribbon domain-containing protein [Candidatus Acidoferrales bacterium]
MPIYEYRCEKCGTEFEELTTAGGSATVVCKHCASRRVTRVLSAFAVGSGDSSTLAASEPGGCGACGAPQRGMCGSD